MSRVWPVIHFDTPELAHRNAQLAFEAGAYGVFLIHMDGQDDLLDPVGRELIAQFPGLRIGVNYLSLSAEAALQRALSVGYAATWSDSPGVRSDGISDQARSLADQLAQHPDHEFFGSVAFKYQPVDANPGEAALRALDLGMIPTTSGPATGRAPTIEKLANIRQAIGPQASLALASGATPQNVSALSAYLSDILVATGICPDFYAFDAPLLAEFMAQVTPKAS